MLTRDADIRELFLELVAIPSPSGRELVLGEQIAGWLNDAGVPARFDGSGPRNGSDAGNLIATVPGAPGRPTLLFVAHMDTVESGAEAIRPVVGDGGVIRSAGDTILGADNKSAVAAVMRTCVAAQSLPLAERPTVVAAFTSREESGRMGASLLDLPSLGIDSAFCVDGSQAIGTVITRALGQTTFVAAIHGRAAHAAANPEAGVDAIATASQAVAALRLGRQPGGGSAGVAAIVGGSVIERLGGPGDAPVRETLAAAPTNSVADLVYVRGEVRGYSIKEIEDTTHTIEETFQRVCDERGATLEWIRDRDRMVPPLPGAPDSRALALVSAAVDGLDGVALHLQAAQASLEANYLAAEVDVVAVASGGRDPHQPSESIAVAELDQLEALLARIVELAADG
ncbi:MAG TPA: M20/M25/M40 family metallo-hydrolase [Solirubrobacteraceae bacterium]|nr:M20/M25/M40 family metallo-hydrolase [Solirubrobacteraceae bacterium]